MAIEVVATQSRTPTRTNCQALTLVARHILGRHSVASLIKTTGHHVSSAAKGRNGPFLAGNLAPAPPSPGAPDCRPPSWSRRSDARRPHSWRPRAAVGHTTGGRCRRRGSATAKERQSGRTPRASSLGVHFRKPEGLKLQFFAREETPCVQRLHRSS